MAATAKRTTAEDLAAAMRIGAIDPTTELVTVADAEAAARAAAEAAASRAAAATTASPMTAGVILSGTDHECAIPGCRDGAALGPSQPDRQVKLACPNCGAVARMTAGALAKTSGDGARPAGITCADGGAFVIATRRTYRRGVK